MSTQIIAPTAILPPPDETFREKRRRFLGGSDAYALLNEPQYGKGCATALAYEKLGIEPDYPRQMDDDLMRRGHLLEPVAATLYKERTGRDVVCAPRGPDGNPVPRISKEFSWAGVHVDRTIRAGTGGVSETGDMEIKSRAEGPFLRVLRVGPFPGDLLQVQWANFVTGHKWGSFAMVGVFGSLPLEHYDIQRDEETIDIFKRQGAKFADTVWGKGEVPEPTIPATDMRCRVCAYRLSCRGEELDAQAVKSLKVQKSSKADLVQIENPELSALLSERELIRAEVGALDSDKEEAPGRLQMVEQKIIELQGVCKAYVPGFGKSYVSESSWSGLDTQRLKAEKPELYEQYFIKGRATGSKTLRTYPEKQ